MNGLFTIEEAVKGTKCYPVDTNVQDRITILNGAINAGKIPLIKVLREWFNIGLKESKDISEEMCVWNYRTGVTHIHQSKVRSIASGKIAPEQSIVNLRKGINISIRNWQALGYQCVEDALIDFLKRTQG